MSTMRLAEESSNIDVVPFSYALKEPTWPTGDNSRHSNHIITRWPSRRPFRPMDNTYFGQWGQLYTQYISCTL